MASAALTTIFTPPASCFNAQYTPYPGAYVKDLSVASSECYPSGFKPLWTALPSGLPFSPGVCPSGYTYATTSVNNDATSAVCCPPGMHNVAGGLGCYEQITAKTNLLCPDGATAVSPGATIAMHGIYVAWASSDLSSFTPASAPLLLLDGQNPLQQSSASPTATTPTTSSTKPSPTTSQTPSSQPPSTTTTHISTSMFTAKPLSSTLLPSQTTPQTRPTSTQTLAPTTTPSPTSSTPTPNPGLSVGAQAGIGAGAAVIGLSLLALAGACILRKRKRSRALNASNTGFETNSPTAPNHSPAAAVWHEPKATAPDSPYSPPMSPPLTSSTTHHHKREVSELSSEGGTSSDQSVFVGKWQGPGRVEMP